MLLRARADLSRLLDLAPGPDLGTEVQNAILYKAAYQRYDGNLYREARLTDADALGHSGGRVLIVSALYGLVTPLERIRDYDLEMSCRLPDGRKVYTWWKDRDLGAFVCEAAERLCVDTICDLLSGNYRKALLPWPPSTLRATYNLYQYPGRGTGSIFDRGKDLRRLLGSE